ncbi:unnamed protein product [Paramecium octaurelia]|uniref:RING-type domain-containing protein n=1 Tax=Paramecium octaurelia TaxID=43137 RepID=A0A8S1XX96_PAROT|nr:unnamed protein product [Paramecium octaurelia]
MQYNLQIIQLTEIKYLLFQLKRKLQVILCRQRINEKLHYISNQIPPPTQIIIFQSTIVISLMIIINYIVPNYQGFFDNKIQLVLLEGEEIIQKLTMQKIYTLDDKIVQIPECSICLLPLNIDLCIIVDCGHVFHKECVASLKQSAFQQCPVCRVQMKNVCDIFYTIKIKDVQDEPKYMANMIQIITLKEEIEKFKQNDKDHHEKVLALQEMLKKKELKIQLLRKHYKNQKVEYNNMNGIFIQEHNQIIDLYHHFGNMLKSWVTNNKIPNQLDAQSTSNSQSSEQNSESQDDEEEQSSNQMDQFEDQQNKVANFLKQITTLVQDKLNQKKREEENQKIQQSKSQKKQCLKEIQSFEKTQRQHN